MTEAPPAKPPTIGRMKALGLADVWVTCTRADCGRDVTLSFDQLGLPDDLLCQSASNSFQETAPKSFQLVIPLSAASGAV